ncbi:transporter [Dokdonella sp.]|uniref:SphA family protein n=1 Tax=Dokdonella sp. TaxID=2291710 RepID=UPI0035276C9F
MSRSTMMHCSFRPACLAAALSTLYLAIGATGLARADEGGVPFWFSGAYASLAAVPATPGWTLPVQGYYYSGDASATRSFQQGDSISAGVRSTSPLILVQPTYAPKTKLWGGQAALGLGFGYGQNRTRADVSITPGGTEFGRSDTTRGGTDLYPVASLAWNHGVHNAMVYITGDIPIGSYDSNRLANLGIGHAAVDMGGGYTYLDEKSGREFSAVLGLTYNWENEDTNYRNGVDSHLDWAASQFLSANWQVGIAGYVYYQLTGDSGSGAVLGPFKSRVAAIGPEVGYVFAMGGKQAYTNVRGYYEFWARNRVEGHAVFATLAIPLGK